MPTSEKQLAANRANSLKSTGPRTPEGKAAASMNAVRHGLFARTLILPSEDPAEFEAFAAGLLEDLRPEGPLETNIATHIVATAWRLRRAPIAEAALFSPDECAASPPAPNPNGFVSRNSAHLSTQSIPSTGSTPPNPAASSPHSSDSSYLSDPSDLTSPEASPKNGFVPDPLNPGTHYLRRLRPGADPLAGLSRHEARLHRQFERDLKLFDAARDRRLKREHEDRARALRRAQDPSDPLYDPALDPLFNSRQRRLARAALQNNPSVAPTASPENGSVCRNPPHVAAAPSPHPSDPSDPSQVSHTSDQSDPSDLSHSSDPSSPFHPSHNPSASPRPHTPNDFVPRNSPHVAAAPSPHPSYASHPSASVRSGSPDCGAGIPACISGSFPHPSPQPPNAEMDFVPRKSPHTPRDVDALLETQLRLARLYGLPETHEEVPALF